MTPRERALQRRYRRLLAAYPRDFRERNGEELLSVLLESADGGNGSPDRATPPTSWHTAC